MKRWLSTLLASAMVWQLPAGNASADTAMEELLFGDIPIVFVGTRLAMPITETPGIVTAYSAKDMKDLGYYTITELANITPGYSTQSYWGEETLTTRGMKTANFENNKHLLLIDDIPVNFLRQNKVHQGQEFPLFGAEQVEFLRGPASASYGTGAFYGVVNVRTKELDTVGSSFEARSFGGSLGSELGQMANMLHTSEAGAAKMSIGYYKRDSSYKLFGHNPNRTVWDDQTDVFMNFSYKLRQGALNGLKLGYILIRRQTGLGESFYGGGNSHSSELNDIYFLSSFPYLKYDKKLADRLSLMSYVKVGQGAERGFHEPFTEDGPAPVTPDSTNVFAAYNKNFREYEALGQLTWELGSDATLLGGVNYDWRVHSDKDLYIVDIQDVSGGNQTHINSFTLPQANPFKLLGVFGQYTDKFDTFGGGTFITAGGRYDSDTYGGTQDLPSATVTQFSPRGAIVQKFNDNLSLKLLYGTALRTPSLKEMQAQGEARSQGNPVADKLKPETIETSEVGLVFTRNSLSGTLTGFQIIHKDALSSSVVVNPANGAQVLSYRNSDGDVKSTGFEVELKGKLASFLQAFGNYSYADAESTGLFTVDPSVDAPKSTWNVGLTATFSRVTASAVVRNVGKYKGPNGRTEVLNGTGSDPVTNPAVYVPISGPDFHGHTTTDVITRWKVNDEMAVTLEGRNLGSEYHLPNSDFIQSYSQHGVLVPTNLFRAGVEVKF